MDAWNSEEIDDDIINRIISCIPLGKMEILYDCGITIILLIEVLIC